MSNHAVANRYAVALFELAGEKGQLKEVGEQLQLIKDVVTTTPELLDVLNHPKIGVEKKQQLLQSSFGDSLSDIVTNTLFLLIERRRTEVLLPFIHTFKELSYEKQNIAEATVYSAKPLTTAEAEQLSTLFAKKVGKDQLIVTNIVDQKIIGGLKIRIGDRIYDGTIKGQLDRLERDLVKGARA